MDSPILNFMQVRIQKGRDYLKRITSYQKQLQKQFQCSIDHFQIVFAKVDGNKTRGMLQRKTSETSDTCLKSMSLIQTLNIVVTCQDKHFVYLCYHTILSPIIQEIE